MIHTYPVLKHLKLESQSVAVHGAMQSQGREPDFIYQ